MKKTLLLAVGLAMSVATYSQRKIETTLGADFVNTYVWRGQELGHAAVQPTLGVGYKGLSLAAWGSYGLTDPSDTKELDLTLGYTAGGFSIGVTDYWFSEGLDPQGRYFRYDAHATNHLFEASVGYDFGPLAIAWYTNFAGNDGTNPDGKRAYSSYVEANVPFNLCGVDWTATAGAVPFATTAYATSGFAVTNISLRATSDVKVTDAFSIPVFCQLTANPCAQTSHLVVGFTLQP